MKNMIDAGLVKHPILIESFAPYPPHVKAGSLLTPKLTAVPGIPENRKRIPSISRFLPYRMRMPRRLPDTPFVGRVGDLWAVHEVLTAEHAAVITAAENAAGVDGIGKSRLAVEYVYRFSMSYPGGIFWLEGPVSVSDMIIQLLQGAKDVILDEPVDEWTRLGRLWDILAGSQPILVVIDDFSPKAALEKLLPKNDNISILIISRLPMDVYGHIRLPLLTRREIKQIMFNGNGKIGKEAESLVDTAGGLPLAAELIKARLKTKPAPPIKRVLESIHHASSRSVVNRFVRRYASYLLPDNAEKLGALILLNRDEISYNARFVLEMISVLASRPTPLRLIMKGIRHHTGYISEIRIREAINFMEDSLFLVYTDRENDPSTHFLISAFIKTDLPEENDIHASATAAIIDEIGKVRNINDIISFQRLDKTVPHAEHLLGTDEIEPEQAIFFSDCLGLHYQRLQRYHAAAVYFNKGLTLSRKHLGEGHLTTARFFCNAAFIEKTEKRYDSAESLIRHAMGIYENELGKFHPFTATGLANLAAIYRNRHKLDESLSLYRDAYSMMVNAVGEENVGISGMMENIADVLRKMGRWDEAHMQYRRILNLKEKHLGSEHPEIVKCLIDIGDLEADRKKLHSAAVYYQKALEIQEKTKGKNDPGITKLLNRLALIYSRREMVDRAESICRRALMITEKTLGPEHPDVAYQLHQLAEIQRLGGRLKTAAPYYERALSIYEKTVHREHSRTALVLKNLAELHFAMGETDKAETLFLETLQIACGIRGNTLFLTTSTLTDLAVLYESRQRWLSAKLMYEKALDHHLRYNDQPRSVIRKIKRHLVFLKGKILISRIQKLLGRSA